MTSRRAAIGRRGEDVATRYVLDAGWRVMARNWRCAAGELDIVARDGEQLVIVEVRTRTSLLMGTPEESVDARKQRRLVRLGHAYVLATGWPGPWRIDVVAIDLRRGEPPVVRHVPNAVLGA